MFSEIDKELAWGLEVEQELAEQFANKMNCTVWKTPGKEDFDYFLCRNSRIIGVIEVKRRNLPMNEYKDTILPLRKITAASAYAALGWVAYFVCQWSDHAGYISIQQPPHHTGFIKREDRSREGATYEGIYAFYEIAKFTLL